MDLAALGWYKRACPRGGACGELRALAAELKDAIRTVEHDAK